MTIALGVDWSGGQAARKKIWAARIDVEERALLRLWRPFADCKHPAEVAAALPEWLDREQFDVAGFDFCFGLAAPHLQGLDLPADGPVSLGQAIRERFADADGFKEAVGPELKRATDLARRATFAPTNLRMYRQTYWGLRALAGVEGPIPPWSFGDCPVVEVFPRHVRRALGGDCGQPEGDEGDAVLAAIAAGAAFSRGFAGAPPDAAASGEGWIYSIN